jgi:hypothetical protein
VPKTATKPLGRYTRHAGDIHDPESLLQCPTREVTIKVPVVFKGDEESMEDVLRKFIEAGYKLSEVWDNDRVKNYPKYLPSFDNFLVDFRGILEDKNK